MGRGIAYTDVITLTPDAASGLDAVQAEFTMTPAYDITVTLSLADNSQGNCLMTSPSAASGSSRSPPSPAATPRRDRPPLPPPPSLGTHRSLKRGSPDEKLKNQKGETLVETLVSLLIIVLVFRLSDGSAVAYACQDQRQDPGHTTSPSGTAMPSPRAAAQLAVSPVTRRPDRQRPRWRSIRRTATATMCRRIRHEKTP
ncbi:MAG: hypothetical protein ACLU38_15360 [Dysosmobacter sp.]